MIATRKKHVSFYLYMCTASGVGSDHDNQPEKVKGFDQPLEIRVETKNIKDIMGYDEYNMNIIHSYEIWVWWFRTGGFNTVQMFNINIFQHPSRYW